MSAAPQMHPAPLDPSGGSANTIVLLIRGFSLVWALAFIYGVIVLTRSSEFALDSKITNADFMGRVFVAAWLPVVCATVGGFWGWFCATSFFLGPIWGLIVQQDIDRSVGWSVVLVVATMGSYLMGRTNFDPAFMLGAVSAPFVVSVMIMGAMLQNAKEAAQKSIGVETDTEARFRMQREMRRQEKQTRGF